MPLEAGLRWRLYSEDLARRTVTANERITSNEEYSEQSSQKQNGSSPDDSSLDESGENGSETEVTKEICSLEELNVKAMNLTLERYSLQRKANDVKFHLVTGDPKQLQLNGTRKVSVDEFKADAYVGILKQLVVDHGWAFM